MLEVCCVREWRPLAVVFFLLVCWGLNLGCFTTELRPQIVFLFSESGPHEVAWGELRFAVLLLGLPRCRHSRCHRDPTASEEDK